MKRATLLLLASLTLAACQDATDPVGGAGSNHPAPLLRATSAQGGVERVMPGRVLARLQDGASVSDVAAAYGLALEGRGQRDAFVMLRGAAGSERALAARLGGDARVVWAEPDYLRQTTEIDSRLWAFYNPGGLQVYFTRGRNNGQPVSSYVSVQDADEDNIESYASGGSSVVIGSIDTGVDFGHGEFLPGQLIAGHDWYSDDSDPSDDNGHGTHTTGTMVGRTVGVAGVAGAGPNVQVYVQRVCGPLGCPTSAIVSAIYAAADYPGMVAMNLSLGGGSESQAEKDAIAYAVNTKGVLVIASAGNDGTSTVSCPACDPLAISVAASDWLDEHAYYTNWGNGLDIIAPGGELYSNTTEEAGIYSAYVGGGYAYLQGTSMAAPQVTGTAAIVASKAGLTGSALRSRIESSADDLGPSGYDTSFGHGRLNSYRAVTNTTLNEGGPPGGGPLTASFSYSCGGISTCDFDGSGSTGATSWNWTFGDGASASGQTVTHTYELGGSYIVTLTVGDGTTTDETNQTVSCTVKGKRLRCS
ncbi:MAG: S8 family serine peptidase [Gemmatimonadota bacterium]|nr:MAG: S8 family serine peptidase [Gemmatimonadota bacterium]